MEKIWRLGTIFVTPSPYVRMSRTQREVFRHGEDSPQAAVMLGRIDKVWLYRDIEQPARNKRRLESYYAKRRLLG